MSKKYNVIYADPPWSYNDKFSSKTTGDFRFKGAGSVYDTMSVSEIKAMPIADLADKDCVLFIWAVSPLLPEAMDVINAWGFKYKTIAFNWVKTTNTGMFVSNLGRWTMGSCEICLLATKGSPKRIDRTIKQLVISERKEHSRKPDIIRKLIVDLMGDVPRVELFARGNKDRDMFDFNKFDGWDLFGNQVDDSISLPE